MEMSGAPILYVTGTNTGVGKTTLALEILKEAQRVGSPVAAMKPFSSGGRDDAEQLHRWQTANLTLDEANPFYFREPVTPLLAARRESRNVTLREALAAIQIVKDRGYPALIEGAGGLLSPLGEGFSLFDIIKNIRGKVCIVAMNSLGCLNMVLLTAKQLGVSPAQQMIVLMAPEQPDASTAGNAGVLRSLLPSQVIELPRTPIKGSQIEPILDFWFS